MNGSTQLLRFGAVGLLSNAVLYLLYLALTASSLDHTTAMTLLYCVGSVQGFALNRRWTFQHGGGLRTAMARYWVVYLSAYLVNLGLLIALVDGAGLPHQIVQAALVVFIAALTFVLQKSWVFPADSSAQPRGAS